MDASTSIQKGIPFMLEEGVAYANGAVVSKTLLKKNAGNITPFSFDMPNEAPHALHAEKRFKMLRVMIRSE